jgi:hypothetical protein
MEYQLHLEKRNEYLYARPVGIRTRESVSVMATEILEACVEDRYARVMVDVRELKGRLGTLDSFTIVTEEFPKLLGKGLRRAAIVDRQISRTRGWFFETVARNRGFNLRMFTDLNAAHEWLAAGSNWKDGE